MKRYLFEFEDLDGFPVLFRDNMTDYLRFIFTKANIYHPVCCLIYEGLQQTDSKRIVDLCSGGGGVAERISESMQKQYQTDIDILLTDKYPNVKAYHFLKQKTKGTISFYEQPIDATKVPNDLKGFRTIFSSFHHFDRKEATAIIKAAVEANEGIGVFDGGERNFLTALGILLFHPLALFLLTPFFRPFRFSRLLFTYLMPIIPFCTIWDGIVSISRLYKPSELLKIAFEADNKNYYWRAGKVRNKFGLRIAYMIGYPIKDQVN